MDLSPPSLPPSSPLHRPATDFAGLADATQDLEPPYAVVDLAALRYNVADLLRRANDTPIRLASKSVRSRAVIRDVLAAPGFAGVLAYTLPEALWLAEDVDDVVVGYPTVDRAALRTLASDERLRSRVTVMIDSEDQLDLTAAAVEGPRAAGAIRVSLDVDASLRLAGGRVHLGARRSPLHSVDEVTRLARAVLARPGFELVGLMAYEAQIAGVGDDPPSRLRGVGVRRMQRTPPPSSASAARLSSRRSASWRTWSSSTAAGLAAPSSPRPSLRSPRWRPARACSRPRCSTTTHASPPRRRPSSCCPSYAVRRPGTPPSSAAGGSRQDRPARIAFRRRSGRRD
jgi:D-serine deaminase-like pyridoxal phosphate-dependent protein